MKLIGLSTFFIYIPIYLYVCVCVCDSGFCALCCWWRSSAVFPGAVLPSAGCREEVSHWLQQTVWKLNFSLCSSIFSFKFHDLKWRCVFVFMLSQIPHIVSSWIYFPVERSTNKNKHFSLIRKVSFSSMYQNLKEKLSFLTLIMFNTCVSRPFWAFIAHFNDFTCVICSLFSDLML